MEKCCDTCKYWDRKNAIQIQEPALGVLYHMGVTFSVLKAPCLYDRFPEALYSREKNDRKSDQGTFCDCWERQEI
jgi:hypothetical protein